MKHDKTVIGLVGMPGSGKTTVATLITQLCNGEIITMGDVVRDYLRALRKPVTREELEKAAKELRQKMGEDAIAKLCIDKVKKSKRDVVVVDGLRSLGEFKFFKRELPVFYLVYIHAPPNERFKRLYKRAREDDPKTWEEFEKRDLEELKLGLGKVIAFADYVIVNDKSLRELKESVQSFLREIGVYG